MRNGKPYDSHMLRMHRAEIEHSPANPAAFRNL